MMRSLILFSYKESAPSIRLMSQTRDWDSNRELLDLQMIMNKLRCHQRAGGWDGGRGGVYIRQSFGQWRQRMKVIAPKKYGKRTRSPSDAGCGPHVYKLYDRRLDWKRSLHPPTSGICCSTFSHQQNQHTLIVVLLFDCRCLGNNATNKKTDMSKVV